MPSSLHQFLTQSPLTDSSMNPTFAHRTMFELIILSSSASESSNTASVQYGGKRETFCFSSADLCNQWTASYSSLSKSLSQRPRDGVAASALLQLIKQFVEEWGRDRLPARTRKAERVLRELAFRPQGTVIPLDADCTD